MDDRSNGLPVKLSPLMMHPLGGGGYPPIGAGYGLDAAAAAAAAAVAAGHQSPDGSTDPGNAAGNGDQNGGAGNAGGMGGGSTPQYSDINQILDQILNITDQSLDEAQVGPFETMIRLSASHAMSL